MARLTAEERRNVSRGRFGVPSKAPGPGSFPMPDKKHAELAERLVGRDPSEKAQVDRKAHDLYPSLGESGIDKALSRHADQMHPVRHR